MGVFKEEAHTFETVAKKQSRIFNDAADYGYPYKKDNPPTEIKDLVDSITSLKKLDAQFPEEKDLVRNRTTWGDGEGVSLDVIIFWEQDEGRDFGTKYSISFNKMKANHPSNLHKGCDAFISVDIEPYSEPTK